MWFDNLSFMKKTSNKTSEEIAEMSGVPRGTVNKIFSGQTKDPQLSSLTAIVHCLGYTLDDLDDFKGNISQPQDDTIKKYHLLNADGKEKVDNYIDDLLQNDKNIATTSHTADTITPFDKFAMNMVKKAMTNANPKGERIKANSIK